MGVNSLHQLGKQKGTKKMKKCKYCENQESFPNAGACEPCREGEFSEEETLAAEQHFYDNDNEAMYFGF
jgi:hypothetical protein